MSCAEIPTKGETHFVVVDPPNMHTIGVHEVHMNIVQKNLFRGEGWECS
jgi:hypothetical protein